MVKIQDLRIGNWVLFNSTPIKVNSELLRNLELYPNDDYYSGILLQPEILEKAGFAIDNKKGYDPNMDTQHIVYTLGELDIAMEIWEPDAIGRFYLWIEMTNDSYNTIWTKIKHLHQLQNLYYSLTGQDIQITF